jgi:hypothetical protein
MDCSPLFVDDFQKMKRFLDLGVRSPLGFPKRKAASSAAFTQSLTRYYFTWIRALQRDALRLLPNGALRAGGDHGRRGHDARPFHGFR